MTDQPYLGRCKHEGCDYALFATSAQVQPATSFGDITAASGPHRLPDGHVFARCSNRHKVFPLKQIKGTYSPDHKCDARCLNARGHECTCSCGGVNHGRGYAVEIHEASDPVIRTSPRHEDGVKLITDKQAAFITRLLDEREIPAKGAKTGAERREHALSILPAMTLAQASRTIEWLLTLEKGSVR
jgi:hypothetical protein